MISLINVIDDMTEDFLKNEYAGVNALTRSYVLAKNNRISISVLKSDKSCELGIMIPETTSNESLSLLPKWKGMECKIVISGSDNKKYLVFHQLEGYEQLVFLNLMQNIIEEVNFVEFEECVSKIKEVLKKWSVFFKFEKDYILTSNVQQGLYGELYVLEKMIQKKGVNALSGWTGCNSESHDFYYGNDAIEIKSSSAKGPERITISNEYQLDDTGVAGKLYLVCLNMKKSEIDGECLPDIVERIITKFDYEQKEIFINKLFKVGYIYMMPELYKYHFRVREESCYEVKDSFPRITPSIIGKGIGSVEYVISLDACSSYLIETELFYKGVDNK